jgi:hypothetical protein
VYVIYNVLSKLLKEYQMSLIRWAVSIVGFPLGGLLAIQVASTTGGPLAAGIAGAIAGAVIGTAQWLALRPRVAAWWIPVTAAAMGVGLAVGTLVTGSATTSIAFAVSGGIAGVLIGAAQGVLLGGIRRPLIWAATTGAAWALGWLITTAVIVDQQRGYAVFGLSGALLVVVATGAVLRVMLGARAARTTAVVA